MRLSGVITPLSSDDPLGLTTTYYDPRLHAFGVDDAGSLPFQIQSKKPNHRVAHFS